MIKVLIIDDEKTFTSELSEFLQKIGFQSFQANSASEGMSLLHKHKPDLLILDVRLPGISGLEILKEVKQTYPQMEVIIVSGHGDMDTVITAMRNGAIDYLRKPFRHLDIQIAIERTQKFLILQQKVKAMEERNSLISKQLEERIERNFIGISPQIIQVLDMAMTAAKHENTNVLITGESGTGKENIARIIHYASARKEGLFCAVNSSAINESLLESEFFGHKKGSFTGAFIDKKGYFEVSDQGTLFLDEIADMPLNLQAKVLRAIEEKKIIRVGDTEQIQTNFRIISATNQDLDLLISDKKFRLDLLHRLKTLHIHIPPLRERPEDIEPLLDYFIEDFAFKLNRKVPIVTKDVIIALKKYSFPGNVRELRNMIERAMILSKDISLTVHDFQLPDIQSAKQVIPDDKAFTLVESEIELLRSALMQCNYNQTKAAKMLGITRDALIRKMKKHHITLTKSNL